MRTKISAIIALIIIVTLLLYSFFSNPAIRFRMNRLLSKAEISAETPLTESNKPIVPNIHLQSAEGKTMTLSDFRGKTVFLNFWATWCGPCIGEMPSINSLKEKLKERDDIAFVMLDVDGNFEKSTAFMQKNNYDLPVYIPVSNIPGSLLGRGIPVTVIINPHGEIIYRHEGAANYDNPEIVALFNPQK